VDEEAWNLLGIAGGLDEALGGPAGAGMSGDASVDDLAAAEGEHDEHVEETSRSEIPTPSLSSSPWMRGGAPITDGLRHLADEGARAAIDWRAAGSSTRTRGPEAAEGPSGANARRWPA